MKRILIAVLLISIAISSVSAIAIPVTDASKRTVFDSPALLAVEDRKINFGIEAEAYADKDFIGLFTNPANALGGMADKLKTFLLAQDDQYLSDNYDEIAEIFAFDPKFPSKSSTVAEDAYWIRDYLNVRFNEIGAGNRAQAAINATTSSLGIYSDDTLEFRGELDLSLRMYGGEIKNGFGWLVDFGLVLDGAPRLFETYTSGDYEYGSSLYMTLGADLGYGTYVGGENFAIGFSFSPDFMFRTTTSNADFITSRVNGSIVDFIMNNTFDFGFSFEFNLGMMMKASDEISLLFNFRNIPSIQTYWYFSADDIVQGFQFHYDENIYYVPPDIAATMLWERGPWSIEFEVQNILNQLLWKSAVSTYTFDIFSIPRLSCTYNFTEDLALGFGYESRSVFVNVQWTGLTVELTCMVDRLGGGLKICYEF